MHILVEQEAAYVATSSCCEAKYRAAFIATIECVWLRRLMVDLGVEQTSSLIGKAHWQL